MSEKLLGINVALTHTTAQHELGLRTRDVVGGAGAGSKAWVEVVDGSTQTQYFYPDGEYMYVLAGSAISAGNACVVDVAAAGEPYTVVPCSAVAQVISGIAEFAIASASYGFIKTKGRVRAAVNTGTISAGARLGSTATAGALAAIAQADSNFASNTINAIVALAAGIGIIAVDSNDSNAAALEVLITH